MGYEDDMLDYDVIREKLLDQATNKKSNSKVMRNASRKNKAKSMMSSCSMKNGRD